MHGAGRPSGCVHWPSCVEALMVYGIAGGKMSYCVQRAGICGFRSYSQQLQVAFLPLLARAGICHEHPHCCFPPYMFCTQELEQMWAFRLGTATDDGLSWNSVCRSPDVWGWLSPESSCRSLARCVTAGPLLTLNFPSSFASPGLS